MNAQSKNSLEIREVNDKQTLNTFIRLPWRLYEDDRNWVPPLLVERKEALAEKNPFFEHARWHAWIAVQNGEAVGRISAQIDDLHQETYGNATGFFGLLEGPEDDAVFDALVKTAAAWLREQGMHSMLGPFNLGINQEIGVLVEGFDSPPYVMMGHARPYYGPMIERCGLEPAQDLLAYELSTDDLRIPRVMKALIERSSGRAVVRKLRRKQVADDLEIMRDIFNDAWRNNWNFVPFTRAEFEAVGKELLMILPDDFIQIAELDGEAAAFVVLIPNVNEAIASLNGRLLPFGWAKLLWRLKVRFPKSGRVALMGVRQKHQNTRFGPALAYMVIDAVIEAGVGKGLKKAEMSWILDHNKGVRNIIESLGGKISKRYRMYSLEL
jgi:hypothetical protein